MKLLIRADDLGYSEGINYGIEKSVREGIVTSVGLMVNMDASEHGVRLISDLELCLGCHTNISAGKPLTTPNKIPSIVDENGYFKSSSEYRNSTYDFVVYDEVILEIEAQYNKFVELTGKKPDYFDCHAIKSDTYFRAVKDIAKKYDLLYIEMTPTDTIIKHDNTYIEAHMDSTEPGYDPFSMLENIIVKANKQNIHFVILHPGYLDNYILTHSSLTFPRPKEVEMAISDKIKNLIKINNIELISYCDLKK